MSQRPGTAPKRPASPGANLQEKGQYALGSLGTGFTSNLNQPKQSNYSESLIQKIGGGSQKPNSASSKNRIRSSSPSSAVIQEKKKQTSFGSGGGTNFNYAPMSQKTQIGAQPLYRGYSPSKPKWKGASTQQHQ